MKYIPWIAFGVNVVCTLVVFGLTLAYGGWPLWVMTGLCAASAATCLYTVADSCE